MSCWSWWYCLFEEGNQLHATCGVLSKLTSFPLGNNHLIYWISGCPPVSLVANNFSVIIIFFHWHSKTKSLNVVYHDLYYYGCAGYPDTWLKMSLPGSIIWYQLPVNDLKIWTIGYFIYSGVFMCFYTLFTGTWVIQRFPILGILD